MTLVGISNIMVMEYIVNPTFSLLLSLTWVQPVCVLIYHLQIIPGSVLPLSMCVLCVCVCVCVCAFSHSWTNFMWSKCLYNQKNWFSWRWKCRMWFLLYFTYILQQCLSFPEAKYPSLGYIKFCALQADISSVYFTALWKFACMDLNLSAAASSIHHSHFLFSLSYIIIYRDSSEIYECLWKT